MFKFILATLIPPCLGLIPNLGDTEEGDEDPWAFLRVPHVQFSDLGKYYGQWAEREADGRRVPHGVGSYIDAASGRVEYAGWWYNGKY